MPEESEVRCASVILRVIYLCYQSHIWVLHVDLSLLKVLLPYLCYKSGCSIRMLQLSLGCSFSLPPFTDVSF